MKVIVGLHNLYTKKCLSKVANSISAVQYIHIEDIQALLFAFYHGANANTMHHASCT